MQTQREIAIVGGGLVGSLLAVFLVRRGHRVTVWEQRPDMRRAGAEGGRSINLVITSRGIRALGQVGLDDVVSPITIPVAGRMMHSVAGELTYQPYGRDDSECNYSVSRSQLNRLLIEQAELRGVHFEFNKRLTDIDLDRGGLTFFDEQAQGTVEGPSGIVLGADGAGSAVRATLKKTAGFEESVEPLTHGYKELVIPAAAGGSYRIEKNALHIWPRGEIMLMALPDLEGSFTVTLYMPWEGQSSFAELSSQDQVQALFERQFPDAIPLIPDLAASCLANPTGFLGTVRCHPWHHRDRLLLIGDAAHAIVPFFGQGMNSGFEDCSAFDTLLDEHGDDWGALFEAFTRTRKPQADAIADMALENFVEMRDRVGDARFLLRKQVEQRLESEWPREYRSRYSMVMYGNVPYRAAQQAGLIQQQILDEICTGLSDADQLDVQRARELIRERLTPFLEREAVSLDY